MNAKPEEATLSAWLALLEQEVRENFENEFVKSFSLEEALSFAASLLSQAKKQARNGIVDSVLIAEVATLVLFGAVRHLPHPSLYGNFDVSILAHFKPVKTGLLPPLNWD